MSIAGKANELKVGYMGWWDKSYTIDFRYPNSQAYVYKSTTSDPACPSGNICNNYFLHPYEFTLDDGPLASSKGGKYAAAYINDKITMNRQLTLNVGVRYDWASSFLDPQGNDGTNPYSIKYQIPYNGYDNSGDVYTFPTYPLFSPRLSFAYDVTGNGRLAVKASYGRYYGITSSPNSQPGPGANSTGVDPISLRTCTYNNWDGTIPVVNSLIQKDFGPDGLMGTADDTALTQSCAGSGKNGTHTFNSSLKANYLDEFAGGVELGLNRNYSVRANFQRKFDHGNNTPAINVLLPYSAYTAETCLADPGPDGKTGVGGVGQACYFAVPNTGNSLGQPANPNFSTTDVNYQNTKPGEGVASYTSYDFTFNKAYANHWSFLAGFSVDLGHPGVVNLITPNQMLYNAQTIIPTWSRALHANTTYELPALPLFVGHRHFGGLVWASTYTLQSGDWYSRSVQIKDANGTNETVTVNGHFHRYPAIGDWDQNVSKRFRIKDRDTIELRWSLYNTMNANYVTGYKSTTVTSSSYFQPDGQPLLPNTIFSPRIMEYSAAFKF